MSMTNEEEYDEIVNFIDENMTEYSDGSLSIPEIVEDLHKRFCDLIDESSTMYALLVEVYDEITEVSSTPLSKSTQDKINLFFVKDKDDSEST